MFLKVTSLIGILFFIVGCSNYLITKDELVLQLKDNQNKKEEFQYIPIGGISSMFLSNTFQSNQIEKILCRDSDGKKVYLYPDKNTELEITKKSDGDVVKMYFNTAFIVENKIVGLRSRLIQSMVREVDIDDIEKIEIYTEMAKTEDYVEN
jgi:hypothetical protein